MHHCKSACPLAACSLLSLCRLRHLQLLPSPASFSLAPLPLRGALRCLQTGLLFCHTHHTHTLAGREGRFCLLTASEGPGEGPLLEGGRVLGSDATGSGGGRAGGSAYRRAGRLARTHGMALVHATRAWLTQAEARLAGRGACLGRGSTACLDATCLPACPPRLLHIMLNQRPGGAG